MDKEPVYCTHCHSDKTTKCGMARYGGKLYQKHICKGCGKTFTIFIKVIKPDWIPDRHEHPNEML